MELSVFNLVIIGLINAAVFKLIPKKVRPIYLTTVSFAVCFALSGILAIGVLLFELFVTLLTIKRITQSDSVKGWLVFGVLSIALCLAFFKYNGAFDTGNSITENLIMPLGISFYSFKAISCIVDAYRSRESRFSSIDYAVYLSFFPQIICGPISRIDELSEYRSASADIIDASEGLNSVLRGLFYKIVIADRLSSYTSAVFSSYGSHSSLALRMAAFLYAIEIYCDFAGYSYIVIGLVRMMGIDLQENFRLPYFSTDIRDFWRRWHISLS